MSSPRYTLVRSLGVGALSEATLARRDDGERVVRKRLHRHLAHDAQWVAAFCHEARVLAALAHDGVAKLARAPEQVDGSWEFAQEFIAGESLDAVTMSRGAAMPLGAACELVAQLAAALEHAHTRRGDDGAPLEIVHRDVCPSNVIVTREGRVALVDFGIATSVWRAEPDRGAMKGTRGYMAPEVVTGERDADARSDVFAAGVILYELTVGRRLYEGSAMQVMAAVAEGATPSPARELPGYPAALDAVVARALARDMNDRPTARGLLAALDACGVARSPAALAAALTG